MNLNAQNADQILNYQAVSAVGVIKIFAWVNAVGQMTCMLTTSARTKTVVLLARPLIQRDIIKDICRRINVMLVTSLTVGSSGTPEMSALVFAGACAGAPYP
jgi:hypothetical protein